MNGVDPSSGGRGSAPASRLEVVGVGGPGQAPELDQLALGTLRERIGELSPSPRSAVDIEAMLLPDAEPMPAALIEAAGSENLFTAVEDRVRHATGRGYTDLARLRSGQP